MTPDPSINRPSRLVRVEKSSNPNKKYDATFIMQNGLYRVVPFGASQYQDYTTITDESTAASKRELYILRHQKRENELWKNRPESPAALSRWILWEFRDIQKAITEFRKRFSLK